ncbi:hypothetical protein [Occallatibacter riparius]|uniref:Uncharacterized protein n=1 Tax=Occallatibacter riparius TaxID=1002689 RepID=A0A9J7BSC0_9BACT|nr:hypothetical protein [Occallatibacter riparius]UWZ85487.1 hypothetical protein MOP44_05975 [Occallatibacter riparius]
MKQLRGIGVLGCGVTLGLVVLAVGVGAAAGQVGTFVVSQNGHAVGTASYQIAAREGGFASSSTVKVSMQGLEYSLSKTEEQDASHHLQHVVLSGIVNGSVVSVVGKPDGANFLLNISANGRSSTARLAGHARAVFLPDFDAGALQTLLTLAAAQKGRDLWAVIPKQAGSVQAIQLATYADEQGTLDGKAITVHHLAATIAGEETDLFAGSDDQLLQAELPQPGFALVRRGFVLTPPKRAPAPQQ